MRVGIEFYMTPKGGYRAKLGEATEVPQENGETHLRVVAPIATTELHADPMLLSENLAALVRGLWPGLSEAEAPVVIGAPNGFVLPEPVDAPAAETAAAAPPAEEGPEPDRLEHSDGNPVDRRQLGVMLQLDRRFDRFMDRRVRGIVQRIVGDQLRPGVSFLEALSTVNEIAAGSNFETLSARQAFDLCMKELYRLAMHQTLVSNRTLVTTNDGVG